jgi:hypothetical protein
MVAIQSDSPDNLPKSIPLKFPSTASLGVEFLSCSCLAEHKADQLNDARLYRLFSLIAFCSRILPL